ncbi:hypothetical protein [Brevibacillus porteri]
MKEWLNKNKTAVISILSGLAAIGVTYGAVTKEQVQHLIDFLLSFL